MNNLQVFFQTRIKNTGFLASLGNFFLAPAQMLYIPSKKISIKSNGNIAKVKAFHFHVYDGTGPMKDKSSKQDNKLLTTIIEVPEGPGGFIFPILFIISIPSTFLGIIFKLISYISPLVRESHKITKDKLTPQKEMSFGTEEQGIDNVALKQALSNCLMTGQKIEALVISGIGTISRENLETICQINPRKLVLNGAEIKASLQDKESLPYKMSPVRYTDRWGTNNSWDMSAVIPGAQRSSSCELKVATKEEAINSQYHPGFFSNTRHAIFIVEKSNQEIVLTK